MTDHLDDQHFAGLHLAPALVLGFDDLQVPTLIEVDGEGALFNESGPLDAYTSALVAVRWWDQLDDPGAAAHAVQDALLTFEIEELITFGDVVLTAPSALGGLHKTLAVAWRMIEESDTDTRGNVALECWTRLALGGWTTSLQLRGVLAARCEQAARSNAAADIFLVRTVAAALEQWRDVELLSGLESLAGIEEVECDVALELGMSHMRAAVESADSAAAAASLLSAETMFVHANLEGARPDAVAFMTACRAVASFLQAEPIPAGSARAVSNAVGHWYLGYLSEAGHWRQARAQTGAAWAALVADLDALSALDDSAWLEPITLLADIGRVYVAYNSTTLLADPQHFPPWADRLDPEPSAREEPRDQAVAVALGPRLDAALAASAERLELIDRWLAAAAQHLPDLSVDAVNAIAAARERLREQPPPGKVSASLDSDVPRVVREALADTLDDNTYDQVTALLGPVFAASELLQPAPVSVTVAHHNLQEDLLLKTLNRRISELLPDEHRHWWNPLNVTLTALVRVTSIAIDQSQGGQRRLPWHGDIAVGALPPEHRLADFIAQMLQGLTGIHCHVEVPNIGGGRADVVVPVMGEEFVIEVKRSTTTRNNAQLVQDYADQAAQYTHTRTPFAFLAVLDLTPHESRLGLAESFWVAEWSDGPTTRAVVALRVLANVATPSSLS